MGEKSATKILQVTNIAPTATREQMKSLFAVIGRVDDVRLFPEYDNPTRPYSSKVCYVKFEDASNVMVSLHLTNTVFIDRALIIVPYNESKMPDEKTAMEVAAPPNATGGLLPPTNDWPSNVVNQVTGAGTGQVIHTVDPKLSSAGLPPYPALPGNIDASKVEEIRRTVYVSNLDSTQVTSEMVLNFFSQVGEVKYVRMAGDESQPTRAVYVEFTDQRTIPTVFNYNGAMFAGKPIQIVHSLNSIAKPLSKNQEAITKEIDEAMKKVNEAHSLIAAAVDPDDRKRSRSRSRSKGRHRRHRSRSRSRKSRSKSHGRRSRSRHRSRSRRSPKRRSPKRHSPRRRSKSRSRSRDRKRKEKERKSRRSRSPRKTSRSSKEKHSRKSKSRSVSKSPKREAKSKSLSPPKLDKISNSPSETALNEVTKSPEMPISSPVLEKEKSKSRSPSVDKKSKSRSPPPPKKKRSRSRSPRTGSKSKIKPVADSASKSTEEPREKSKLLSPSRKRRSTSRSRRSTSRSRRRSKSPRRRSRTPSKRSRRSRTPRKRSKSPRRRSPRKRSRSRSHSPKRHRKDKKKERERNRSRSRDRRRHRDRDEKEDKPKPPVKRDYDEEEKGYDSSDQDKGKKGANKDTSPQASPKGSPPGSPQASPQPSPTVDNLQAVDMDMDSD